MSKYTETRDAVSLTSLKKAKHEGRKLSALTCYDAAFARLLDEAGLDIVLVGDSLGNVMLGYENTLPVSLEDMIHHTAAVSRVLKRPFLCADMPFLTYQVSVEKALENAGRLMKEGGAQAVKLEGGRRVAPQVEALVGAGIPVMGHLGFTPQSLHAMGGFKVQGRGREAEEALLADARALEEAGAFSVVLEMVPRTIAEKITKSLKIPTIGIGAGPECDGQILVLHDILGFDGEFQPKFLKKYANLGKLVKEAVSAYDREVKDGSFPADKHSFSE